MKNIVIIGARKTQAKNDPIVLAQALSGEHDVKVVYWEDLAFSIQTNNVVVTSSGEPIFDKANLVIAVGWYRNGKQSIYRDVALSLALYLKSKSIEFWNSEMLEQRSGSKLSCMVKLALSGVPVPTTYFCLTLKKVIRSSGLPCVVKAVSASRGQDNYLLKTEDDLVQYSSLKGAYLVQDFMPNDHDLRVICFAGKPKLVLRRSRTDMSTHLNNTSQGGSAEWQKVESMQPELLTESEKICIIMSRELAGIDFVPDNTSPHGYACLEVNAIPQLTSGYDVARKMAEFANSVKD